MDLCVPTGVIGPIEPRDRWGSLFSHIGLVFARKDGKGLNIMLQALPLDGKIVRRAISESDEVKIRRGCRQ